MNSMNCEQRATNYAVVIYAFPLMSAGQKLGLIAGNGRFPLLLLDAARAQGTEVVVAAIKEETWPEIEQRAAAAGRPGAARVHWMSLGELSKLIETFQREGVTCAIMAGQVKHKQIFSSIRPDWRLRSEERRVGKECRL